MVTNRAADGILNADPYDIKVAIAYMNNFNFSCTQPERWNQALAKIPFLVHITTNASEFSWFADILLPDTHHLFEKWGWVKSSANGYRHVTLMQPVIKPMWESKIDETEIPWLISEKLAQRGFDNMLRYFKTIKDPETGKEPANEKEFALYCVKLTTQNLWDPAKYQGGDKFNGWEEFRKAGVWNSAPYPFRKRWSAMKHQDQEVRVLQRNPQGRPGRARQEAQYHGGRHPGGQRLPGAGRDGVRPALRGAVDPRRRKGIPLPVRGPQVAAQPRGPVGQLHLVPGVQGRGPRRCGLGRCRQDQPFGRHEARPQDGRQDPHHLPDRQARMHGQAVGGSPARDGRQVLRPGPLGLWPGGIKVFGKEPRGGNNNEVLPAVYDRLSGARSATPPPASKLRKFRR